MFLVLFLQCGTDIGGVLVCAKNACLWRCYALDKPEACRTYRKRLACEFGGRAARRAEVVDRLDLGPLLNQPNLSKPWPLDRSKWWTGRTCKHGWDGTLALEYASSRNRLGSPHPDQFPANNPVLRPPLGRQSRVVLKDR